MRAGALQRAGTEKIKGILKMMNFMKKLGFPFFGLVLFLAGCGPYHLGTTLPDNMKTVFVPTFENRTNEPGIEIDVTNAVISRFRVDGNLAPVSEEEADTVLLGKIIGWQRRVLTYTGEDEDEVEEYRLFVIAAITFRDRRTGEVLIPQQRVRGYADFFVSDSLPESEQEAQPAAFKDLARRIVDAAISFW